MPVKNLIGGEEGHGFHHTVAGLELGRINIAARGVGLAKAALDDSVFWPGTRREGGAEPPFLSQQEFTQKFLMLKTLRAALESSAIAGTARGSASL